MYIQEDTVVVIDFTATYNGRIICPVQSWPNLHSETILGKETAETNLRNGNVDTVTRLFLNI